MSHYYTPTENNTRELKNGAYVAVEQVIIRLGGGPMRIFTGDLTPSDLERIQK